MDELETFIKLKYFPLRYEEEYFKELPIEVFLKLYRIRWNECYQDAYYEEKINKAAGSDSIKYLDGDTECLSKLLYDYHKNRY